MALELEQSELMDVLERAAAKLPGGPGQAGPNEPDADPDWVALLTGVLELPLRYLPSVQLALAQGRWRKAKDPKAYLCTVAKRARAMDSRRDPRSTLHIPEDARNEEGEALSLEEAIDFASSDLGIVKVGNRWKARNPVDEPTFVDDEDRVIPIVNGLPVAEDLLMPEDDEPDAKLVINWLKVAERAGLDHGEATILKFRSAGLTREAILSRLARNDEQRRAWQAAWRRLDRHMDRVRAVLAGPPEKCA